MSLVMAVLFGAVVWEARTSTLQARYFSGVGAEVGFRIVNGPSAQIRFPATGPMDERLGYTALSALIPTLDQPGFRIDRQAELTDRFVALVDRAFPLSTTRSSKGGWEYGTRLAEYSSPLQTHARSTPLSNPFPKSYGACCYASRAGGFRMKDLRTATQPSNGIAWPRAPST